METKHKNTDVFKKYVQGDTVNTSTLSSVFKKGAHTIPAVALV
jgi:hypothetical protein